MMKIHIGEMIRRELKAQGRTMTWFANAIHSDRSNAYSIDLALLNKICQLLHHDFFRDCSDALRSNAQPWTGSAPAGEQDF